MTRWQAALLAVALLCAACSGLAGEVAIVATLTPVVTPTAAYDRGYPAQTPDLAQGAILYARHCVACHGADGSGRGELVESGQVPAMPSFLDAAYVRTRRPDEYFEIITNGNLENLMPPWKDSLSEQERWNLAVYVTTLHYTPAQLSEGQALYERFCQECHGDTGKGDGERQQELGQEAYDLSYYRDMVFIPDESIMSAIRDGKGEAMPARANDMTADEMAAVAAYVRGFSTSRATASGSGLAAAQPVTEGQFSISGSIVNGTTGGQVPPLLDVFLRYGSEEAGVEEMTTVAQDGAYAFTGVPFDAGFAYVIYTVYNGQIYTAEIVTGSSVTQAGSQTITIYETAEDPSVIRITGIDLRFEPFPELQDDTFGQGLLVTQTLTFENASDRTFALEQSGAAFSLLLLMPPGAIALNAATDQRFIVVQDQFAVIYTQPVPPGTHPVELIYFLPYAAGAVFDQPYNYPVEAQVTVVTMPRSLTVKGADWAPGQEAPFVNQYTRQVTLAQGDSLVLELEGDPRATTSSDPSLLTADVLVPIVAAAVIVVCAALLLVSLTRRRHPRQETDRLLRQLAELDALHERGQINHDVYQRQRKALKDRLTVLMASSKLE
jgi:mono/diheme cytochrome c family protein